MNPSDLPVTVVICAKLTHPTFTGSFPGFKCINCGQALQATVRGRDAINGGGYPICNKCGFDFINHRRNAGKSDLMFFSPEVRRQMEYELKHRHDNN